MNNYNFLRSFTTDRGQRDVRQTTIFYEKVRGLEYICKLLLIFVESCRLPISSIDPNSL